MAAGLIGPIMSLLHSTIVFLPHWLSYLCVGQHGAPLPSAWCLCCFRLPTCLFSHCEAPLPLTERRQELDHLQWSASLKTAGTGGALTHGHLTSQQTTGLFKARPWTAAVVLSTKDENRLGYGHSEPHDYVCVSEKSLTSAHKPHGVKEILRAKAMRSLETNNVFSRIWLQPDASRRIKDGQWKSQQVLQCSGMSLAAHIAY